MKTARFRLAVIAVTALAGAACVVPAAPAAFPPQPNSPPEIEERPAPPSVFAGTAIGVVLEANGNEVPRNGAEMMRALAKLGEFAQLPVTFSAVDMKSGLTKPRIVIAARPSANAPPERRTPPSAADCLPAARGPTPSALSNAGLTKPNLEGRLFLAANMDVINGEPKVKTFEFISWNSRKQRFDFGFIECHEKEPQIRVVDGAKCFSCHKNKGPILGEGPWSNTPHNDVVREAIADSLRVALWTLRLPDDVGQPRRLDTGFYRPTVVQPPVFDGLSIILPQGPAVDAGVRTGAGLVRDRDVYRALLRSAAGRKAFAALLGAIAAPGALEENNAAIATALNRTFGDDYSVFADEAFAIHKRCGSTLIDCNPSGSVGLLKERWGSERMPAPITWTGSPKEVTAYDARRTKGEHQLPSNRLPSNPAAFVKERASYPSKPSTGMNAMALARLIGLTERDRGFFASKLEEASERLPKQAPAALAQEVFAQRPFADRLAAGEVPDREGFKDRFVQSLNAVLKAHGAQELPIARAEYASGPNVAPVPGQENREPAVVATTACLRCHDVRVAGTKPAFSPIPLLAFDPFDASAREAWATATPAKDRAAVLARVAKRVFGDRDMPPEDSTEYAQFRAKDPDAFAAVRTWLETELLKVK